MGALVLQAACIWETYYHLQALLAIVNTYLVCDLHVYFPSVIFLHVANSGWLHAKGEDHPVWIQEFCFHLFS